MANPPRSGTADDAALLLSQVAERLQTVTIDGCTVVLSAYDVLPMGGGEALGADWRNQTTHDGTLFVFAETIALAGGFYSDQAVVSAHSVRFQDDRRFFDVSGSQGARGIPQPDAKANGGAATDAGQSAGKKTPTGKGGDGGDGGKFRLSLENWMPATDAPPHIVARGGAGGPGATGSEVRAGSDGGDGGKGGDVIAVISHPYARWQNDLLQAAKPESIVSRQALAARMTAEFPSAEPFTTIVAWLNDSSLSLAAALARAQMRFGTLMRAWAGTFSASVDVSAGDAGAHGVGKADGKNGSVGSAGSAQVQVIGAIDGSRPAFFSVHPAQCAMLLEKVKAAYLFLDPKADAPVADVAALLDRLRARTAPFVGLSDDDPVARLYDAREHDFGCVDARQTLARIHSEASSYLTSLKHGLDMFGYAPGYVPLIRAEAITREAITPLLDHFGRLEREYNAHFDQLRGQDKTLDHIKKVRGLITEGSTRAQVDTATLADGLTTATRIIDGYQSILPGKLEVLNTRLQTFKSELTKFSFGWDTLLSAFGQLAFAPESQAMLAFQAANVTYQGATEVTDIEGHQVRREFVIKQLDAITADIGSITQAVSIASDGSVVLADPGARKLLADERALEAMLDREYVKFGGAAAGLKAAIEDYVQTVLARNTQVVAYNANLNLLAQVAEQKRQMSQETAKLNDQALAVLRPDLPSLTTFVSQAYYALRAEIIEFMNLASRAHRFWQVQDVDIIRGALARTSGQVDAAALLNLQDYFWGEYTKALGRGDPQVFPDDPDDSGVLWTVPDELLAGFRQTGTLMVRIPAGMKGEESVTAAKFKNMAEVRVNCVRAYIEGARIASDSDLLNVVITHTGTEDIVSTQNRRFRFVHEPLVANFTYHLKSRQHWQDGNLQVSGKEDVTKEATVALAGPFTYWQITVPASSNRGLVLDDVTQVTFEFRGTSRSFV